MFLDWLSFTFKVTDAKGNFLPEFINDGRFPLVTESFEMETRHLLYFWEKYFPELVYAYKKSEVYPGQLHGYNNVRVLDDGLMLMYNDTRPDMGIHISASSTGLGSLLSLLGFVNKFDTDSIHRIDYSSFFLFLRNRLCVPSRIDFTYDDYLKRMMPMDVFNARHERCALVSSTRAFDVKFDGGVTFYLGKRTSERFLRVYDKRVQSKGVIDAVRWELEFKGRYCRDLFNAIIDHPSDGWTFGNLLFDYMHIKEGSYEYNLNELGIRVPTHVEMVRRRKADLDPIFSLLLAEMSDNSTLNYQFNREKRRVSYEERVVHQEENGVRKAIHKSILGMSMDQAINWIFDCISEIDIDDLADTIDYLNDLPEEQRKCSLYYKYYVE